MSAPTDTPLNSELLRLVESSQRVLGARRILWVDLGREPGVGSSYFSPGAPADSRDMAPLFERLAALFPALTRPEQAPLLQSEMAGEEAWAVSAPPPELPEGGRRCLVAIRESDRLWTRSELEGLDTAARLLMDLSRASQAEVCTGPDGRRKLEEVGLLASRMAHDFNNLTAVISGCSEILMDGLEPSSSQHAAAAQIRSAAARAAEWTGQLLALTGGSASELEADPPLTSDAAAVPPEPARPQTILLVDDQESVRDVVSLILKDAGYAVLTASGGSEALAVAAAHEGGIDLLLTDMVMPGGINGRELAAELVGLRPGLPVILMSGFTDDAQVRGAISRGELAFIPKPFRPGDLLHKVRGVLAENAAGEISPPPDRSR